MIYRFVSVTILVLFYGIYLFKMLGQRLNGITTDQLGAGKKTKRQFVIEILLKSMSMAIVLAQLASIVMGKSYLGILAKVFGCYFGVTGIILFFMSVTTMKDNWRAGIAIKDKTSIVKEGIYKYSRNPAFLAFYLVYISTLLMYFSWWLFVITLITILVFHLQILEEEKFLNEKFGDEYKEYKANTLRYFGTRPVKWRKIKCVLYLIGTLFSIYYFITCVIYAGITLSLVWIWLLIAAFCFARFIFLKKMIEKTKRVWIPKIITVTYRSLFACFLIVFVIVELSIIVNINIPPKKNLDYIVVLGAGVRNSQPSAPFRQRLEKAYDYMVANPDTIMIASGGQGPDENISEAQCMLEYMEARGLDGSRIILENRSTSTEENLLFSYELIENKEASVGLVTNGFHMLRARLIALTQGHRVSSVSARTLFPVGIHYMFREFFGIVHLFFSEIF